MVGGWWLKAHPEFKPLERGAGWLVGFRDRLMEDELHPIDWGHIKELAQWHEGKDAENIDTQPVAGSSSETM